MGKFGGTELNYSSDIDVVFFYGDEGNLNPRFTYHEFFTRLAENIIRIFSATADPLFRIDVRLRPEGGNGPLVRSLASMENYYAGYGETWERMALIKARGRGRRQGTSLRIQPAVAALYFSTNRFHRSAGRNRGAKRTDRKRDRRTGRSPSEREARIRRHPGDRIHLADFAALARGQECLPSGAKQSQNS